MAVYVDSIKSAAAYRSQNWRFRSFCHMVADSEDELHAMAKRLGLRRDWFQPNVRPWLSHYDLTASKRVLAVKFGAIEHSAKNWVREHLYATK